MTNGISHCNGANCDLRLTCRRFQAHMANLAVKDVRSLIDPDICRKGHRDFYLPNSRKEENQ